MSTDGQRKSIFTASNEQQQSGQALDYRSFAGYILQPDASLLDYRKAAYFKIHGSAESTSFWQMIITKFSETHEEKYSLQQSLSDGVLIHALGSNPIRISIDGVLAVGQDINYRIRFLQRYLQEFRAKRLSEEKKYLEMRVRRTSFLLEVESFAMEINNTLQDYVSIGITGIAHHYKTDNGDLLDYPYATAKLASEDIQGAANVHKK